MQFALLNVTSLSFVMIYTLESAFVFLLGWEIAAVAAWLLVVWDYRNQKVRFAGFNYLVSTHIGLFFLVAAFMVLHSQTGSMDFQQLRRLPARPEPAARRHLRAAGHLLRRSSRPSSPSTPGCRGRTPPRPPTSRRSCRG